MRSPNKNLDYTAHHEKIFDIIRAIYLYGPIFSDPDNFNFEYTDVEDDVYTLSFQTKTSAFPKKTECLSKGTLQFNKNSNKIIKMDFSFFDYQSTTVVRYRSKNLPFKTEVSIKIGYDSEGHAYVCQCGSSTMWNSNFDSETYAVGRHPSRPFSTKNRLVEKEFWSTESYKVLPESLKDKETDNQAGWAAISMGIYNKEFFKNNPCPISSIDEFQQLNRYMPLEDQYKLNSGNFYGYYETLQTLEKRLLAKRIIFEKFDKLNN